MVRLFKTTFLVWTLLINGLFTVAQATSLDNNRVHNDKIRTVPVYIEVILDEEDSCKYEIIGRYWMDRLWKRGLEEVEEYEQKIKANPLALEQDHLTQEANDKVNKNASIAKDYSVELGKDLLNRHHHQDEQLDHLVQGIEKLKEHSFEQSIQLNDAEGITTLLLAKKRFELTSQQIQEKLVYYDELDDRVEKTIDAMIVGLPEETEVYPAEVQDMAVFELYLDNFRSILHKTKGLTEHLSKCYNKLSTTYAEKMSSTTVPNLPLKTKRALKFMSNMRKVLDEKDFINSPGTPMLKGKIDLYSQKYLKKLEQDFNAPASKAQNRRRTIALSRGLKRNIGPFNGTLAVNLDKTNAVSNEVRQKYHEKVKARIKELDKINDPNRGDAPDENFEQTLAKADSGEEQAKEEAKKDGDELTDFVSLAKEIGESGKIEKKNKDKLIHGIKSQNHKKDLNVFRPQRVQRLTYEEYRYLKKNARDYRVQKWDSLFVRVSKAYFRAAYPVLLRPVELELESELISHR